MAIIALHAVVTSAVWRGCGFCGLFQELRH